ncbi:hypothetical protein, partial [Mycobacterium intracellulare]|uniref:hypothetical protein n=1 Tax=Mycobacterium intracellulare TaxID=1767 RepID=UPI0006CA6536
PLEVVPDPDDRAANTNDDAWQAYTAIDQYSAEHQFVGSLMWLPAEKGRPLLKLVPDTAIWRPLTRWAYELIRSLIEAGTDPTPPTVLAAGRHQPARDALEPATAPTANQQQRLALYLFDAYAQAVAPSAAVGSYARTVLDDAYRRAFDTCGIRMQQLAATVADRDELTEQFTAIRDELADLWRRAEDAAKPQRSRR